MPKNYQDLGKHQTTKAFYPPLNDCNVKVWAAGPGSWVGDWAVGFKQMLKQELCHEI